MTEPIAATNGCAHHYEHQIRVGEPLTVSVCLFCRTPDWNDLREQVAGIRDAARTAAARQTTGQDDTHPGYDNAGYPEKHAGPREKCPDPACETDQHANCGAECPAVGQPAEAHDTDEVCPPQVRWTVQHVHPRAGTVMFPGIDDRDQVEERLRTARSRKPESTHRLVRETTTWTVEDER